MTGCLPFFGLAAGCGTLPDPNVRYIAFGDSTTDGPTDADYPEFLRKDLGEPPETFAIEANGGETAAAGLERFRQILDQDQYPNAHTLLYWQGATGLLKRAVELDPLLSVSPLDADYPNMAEVNMLLDDIEASIKEVIALAQGAGMRVYIATYFPPPNFYTICEALPTFIYFPEQQAAASGYIDLLNTRLRRAAANTGATVVDVATLASEFRANPTYYYDCNHLSAQGNERIAQLFADTIRSEL